MLRSDPIISMMENHNEAYHAWQKAQVKERILIRELHSKLGETVIVAGWLHRLRDLSKFGFAILRDRTGLVQVVLTT